MSSPFSQEALRRQVDLAIAAIPPGKKRVALGYVNTDGVWCIAYAERVNNTWKWGAQLEGDMKAGKIQGEVFVQGSW